MATFLKSSLPLREAVLDTDVFSFLYKGSNFGKAYAPYLEQASIYISFQTVAELYLWTQRSNWGEKRIHDLVKHLKAYNVVHSSPKLAWRWALLTEQVKGTGKVIHAGDAWVAATALELDIPLVTHNTKDYLAVEGSSEIRVRLYGSERIQFLVGFN